MKLCIWTGGNLVQNTWEMHKKNLTDTKVIKCIYMKLNVKMKIKINPKYTKV